jgi:hypothetical protein
MGALKAKVGDGVVVAVQRSAAEKMLEISFADDANDLAEIDHRNVVEIVVAENFFDFQEIVFGADRYQVFVVGHQAGDRSE